MLRPAILVMLVAACAAPRLPTRPYRAQWMITKAPPRDVLATILAYGEARRWTIASRDDRHLELISPVLATADGSTRQRWRFALTDDHVLAASMRLELRDGQTWRSSDRVCTTYAYTDEWLLLGALDAMMTNGDDEPPPTLIVDAR